MNNFGEAEEPLPTHPAGYDYTVQFPALRRAFAFEGGAYFTAEKKGRFYLIADEGSMADFLDEDDQHDPIAIREFATSGDRSLFLARRRPRGRPNAWALFGDDAMPARLMDRLLGDVVKKRPKSTDHEKLRFASYLHSYPAFVSYFAKRERLSSEELTIAAAFTYAWMPRVAVLRPERTDGAVTAFEWLRAGHTDLSQEIGILAGYLNDSLTGASKLLHFAEPELFAIWDRRVAAYLGHSSSAGSLTERIGQYVAYVALCRAIVHDERMPELQRRVAKKFGVDVGPLRAAELVMFANGGGKRD